ncbi:hypothetical protein sp82g_174 [Bacillus phage SP82G]|nr:hypothetical protein sp82g_174 [Bacillus phage SP82G]
MSGRKKLTPPTHFDPEYLFKKYELLRKSVYKKFKDKMINQSDREDLMGTIDQIFLQLVSEYNPNRGVDFPYYIKRMLELRTYHHITKYLKRINGETSLYVKNEDGEVLELQDTIADIHAEEIFSRIVDLHSINPYMELGEKHRNLMIGLFIRKKTLQELAQEEGVPLDRLHARLYFLIRKFEKGAPDRY